VPASRSCAGTRPQAGALGRTAASPTWQQIRRTRRAPSAGTSLPVTSRRDNRECHRHSNPERPGVRRHCDGGGPSGPAGTTAFGLPPVFQVLLRCRWERSDAARRKRRARSCAPRLARRMASRFQELDMEFTWALLPGAEVATTRAPLQCALGSRSTRALCVSPCRSNAVRHERLGHIGGANSVADRSMCLASGRDMDVIPSGRSHLAGKGDQNPPPQSIAAVEVDASGAIGGY